MRAWDVKWGMACFALCCVAVDPWVREELQKMMLVRPQRSKVLMCVEALICALMVCAMVVFFVYTFSYTPKLILYNRYDSLLDLGVVSAVAN
jgi:hypothetical protein